MQLLLFRYVYLLKHTSRPTTCCKYCTLSTQIDTTPADSRSADLEMTVNTLIQIDKLVQLLESPVFTCKLYPSAYSAFI